MATPSSIYRLEGKIDKPRGAPPASQGLGQMVQGCRGTRQSSPVLSGKNRIHFYHTWGRAGDGKRAGQSNVNRRRLQGAEFGELPRVYLME